MTNMTYLALGCLAAHAQAETVGFRQREVKFFSELFSNWTLVGGVGTVQALHNTQVSRYLMDLVHDGRARPQRRASRQPRYRLTRAGMFSLLSEITERSYLSEPHSCWLVWYFLRSYTPQIRKIIAAEGSEFSRAHALELEMQLDVGAFLARQLRFTVQEIGRLRERIEATEAMYQDVKRMRAKGASMLECATHVAKKYPYEMNAHRSFQELLATLPKDVLEWELTEGSAMKSTAIFHPILGELELHQAHLEALQRTA